MGLFFYNIFILFYSLGIKLASFWNPKAKKWVEGRRLFSIADFRLQNKKSTITDDFLQFSNKQKSQIANLKSNIVWMHCASVGEFEQGRPVLEELKRQHEELKIVLTFFSPSGYEACKNYKGADCIYYLPMDGKQNAKKFIDAINPSLVLWVKYEFWYYYLTELKSRAIPVLLVSGVLRSNQPFFKWYGGIWRQMINCFHFLFLQNDDSKKLADSLIDKSKSMVSGDTRFDRVVAIAENFTDVPEVKEFCGSNKVIVAGSTWEEDEAELIHYVKKHPEIKFIIAPHEIDSENIKDVQKEFPNSILYSQLSTFNFQLSFPNCLIIDNIGLLSRLYKYGTITYVGGGFGADGVHNVLEAAVYGKPVIYGTEYEKFAEAIRLIESGGGIEIENALELEKVLDELLDDEKEYKLVCDAAKKYVYENAGATQIIITSIEEAILH